jgi:hypothetical protein
MPGPAAPPPPDPPPYVYAANDIHPRTAREIELCNTASHFDWIYSGTLLTGVATSVWANIQPLKNSKEPGLRLLGPGIVGLTWGAFLTGSYLSLPKCDPNWVEGPGPEGNIRATWPIATVLTLLAGVSAPFIDYSFLGPIKTKWPVPERGARIFIAGGAGIVGALIPFVLPPSTWRAKKEIEKLRVEGTLGGASIGYVTSF